MPNNLPGHTYEKDEYGEYDVDAGSATPTEDRCNAVLKHTMSRYGETRYCTRLPENCFIEGGSYFCRTHKSHESLMEQAKNVEHMAFITSYLYIFDRLPTHKRVIAIELYRSFLSESVFNFELEEVDYVLDLSDATWTQAEEHEMKFPVPTNHKARARALWYCALQYMQIESISETIFKDAFQDGFAIGERETIVTVTEGGNEITDKSEHHLNLSLSRIVKDHKDLLKFGGVPMQGSDEASDDYERDWVFVLDPEQNKNTPHATDEEDPFLKNVDEADN